MMLESKQCHICLKNSVAVKTTDHKAISGISEIKIMGKPVLLTDTSILFCVINGYDTVSKIRVALDNAYYKGHKIDKIIFGGRTEGNLRARLKVLDQLGLVIMNLHQSGRVPTYSITNLGLAVQNTFMAGLDLFNKACSDCISSKVQRTIKEIEAKEKKDFHPGQKEELSF